MTPAPHHMAAVPAVATGPDLLPCPSTQQERVAAPAIIHGASAQQESVATEHEPVAAAQPVLVAIPALGGQPPMTPAPHHMAAVPAVASGPDLLPCPALGQSPMSAPGTEGAGPAAMSTPPKQPPATMPFLSALPPPVEMVTVETWPRLDKTVHGLHTAPGALQQPDVSGLGQGALGGGVYMLSKVGVSDQHVLASFA